MGPGGSGSMHTKIRIVTHLVRFRACKMIHLALAQHWYQSIWMRGTVFTQKAWKLLRGLKYTNFPKLKSSTSNNHKYYVNQTQSHEKGLN